jgi:hypothetical protein
VRTDSIALPNKRVKPAAFSIVAESRHWAAAAYAPVVSQTTRVEIVWQCPIFDHASSARKGYWQGCSSFASRP